MHLCTWSVREEGGGVQSSGIHMDEQDVSCRWQAADHPQLGPTSQLAGAWAAIGKSIFMPNSCQSDI
ncbi:hypothetical protein EXN66_Car019089 [Channa argus]|uniref:Uncharacterized protein n=1 Tax=Channa argus TaxID=215402 RepID=A0A6G1QL57_CHAAH|nr:hypothetical protein EXN66_Car019089 [Channa argus]